MGREDQALRTEPALAGPTWQRALYGGHEFGIGRSVADENRIADQGIVTVVLGPVGGDCHCPNEWVEVDSLRKLTETYAQICKDFPKYLEEAKNGK